MPDSSERVFRLDLAAGAVKERRRTPQGGLVVNANLTRTGVFAYRMPDGTSRRELRPADEVFHPDSLASYTGAPTTIDHPGKVDPSNWREVTRGHVAHGARRSGDFVSGEVHLQDARAIQDAESDKLREVSCGYSCDIDPTPGMHNGEPYDVVQRNIRINHVALGPEGWGRMGKDTRLHLDARDAVSGERDESSSGDLYVRADDGERSNTMTPEEKAQLEKVTAELETLRSDSAKLTEESTRLRAENDALKLQADRQRIEKSTVETRQREDADFERRVDEMIALRADARSVFATVDDPQGLRWDSKGKVPSDIRREVIKALEPKQPLVYDGKELDGAALRAVYDIAISRKRDTDKAREEQARAARDERHDAYATGGDGDDDAVDVGQARKDMVDRMKNAWKGGGDKKDKRRGDARRSA